MISISQWFTHITKILKNHGVLDRLGVFIKFCYLVENKTNYISFKRSPHAERNGTSHSFIPPTTAVKKQKAPRKHPPKLMYCAVYRTGKVV